MVGGGIYLPWLMSGQNEEKCLEDEMIAEYVASCQAAGDSRSMREIAEEYNDKVIYPDKVRLRGKDRYAC